MTIQIKSPMQVVSEFQAGKMTREQAISLVSAWEHAAPLPEFRKRESELELAWTYLNQLDA